MKKLLAIILAAMMMLSMAGCVAEIDTTDNANSNDKPTVLLLDQENVKISFSGIGKDIGIGESMILLVENFRSESIIVNISEVSLNGVMKGVIQPQMPLHLTSPGKKSNQPYTFTNTKIEGSNAQFKIKILDENFEEIFVSDFVEVSF